MTTRRSFQYGRQTRRCVDFGAVSDAPAAISVAQAMSVEVAGSTLGVITMGQTVDVQATGATSSLPAAQLDGEFGAAVITLGGTPYATGTAPPVMTLTGTLLFGAGAAPGIRVEINSVSGGTARGQAFFRVSYDSGATWALAGAGGQLTAATVALDGAASGVTLNFPVGTYGTDQVWEGTVTRFRSTEGNSYTFDQATASAMPILRKAAVNPEAKDALACGVGGVTRWMASTDAAVVALFTGDPALTVMGRVAYDVVDAVGTWLSACSSADPTNHKRRFQQIATGVGRLAHAGTRGDGVIAASSTTTADPTVTTAAHNECWTFPGANGGTTCEVDGVGKALTATASDWVNGGATTMVPTRVAIGCEADSTPSSAFAGLIYRFTVFNTALSSGDRALWNTELAA